MRYWIDLITMSNGPNNPSTVMYFASIAILLTLTPAVAVSGWSLRTLLCPRHRASHPRPRMRRDYLARPISRLAWSFLAAYGSWWMFYVFLAIQLSRFCPGGPLASAGWIRAAGFLADVMTNATSFCLVFFYFELSAFDRAGIARRHAANSRLTAWLFLTLAILIFELLSTFGGLAPIDGGAAGPLPFKVVYGLGQATALFLVVGRLESSGMSDHIGRGKAARDRWLRYLQRGGVAVGYLYASIQPLYFLFDDHRSWVPVGLVGVALILKLLVLYWVVGLFMHLDPPDRPSAMEYHLYETIRFRTEEGSAFERSFLRRHFNPRYRKHVREREIGYLGVEYAYLNQFKIGALRLEGTVGAALVREVYAGSDAVCKGIRTGDLITSINDMPLTTDNRLSDLLAGAKPGSNADVVVLRKRTPSKAATGRDSYIESRYSVRLGNYDEIIKSRVPVDARVELGYRPLYDSLMTGVVCTPPAKKSDPVTILGIRSGLSGRFLETPDLPMLRMAMATLVAGETVELTLQGLTRHDPVKLAWGELHMSCDCFSEADDAVPGTPSRRERRPAPHRHPTRVMEEVRKRIVEAYPDRFGPEADKHGEMSLETLAALGGGCWVVCFDSDYAKVCEFCLSGLRTPWDFQEWKIWDHIESGSIFAHARVLYSKEPKLLSPGPEGTFFSFHHDRNAGRPCSAPRL